MTDALKQVGSRDPNEFQTELPEVIVVDPKKATTPKKPTTSDARRMKDKKYQQHGWYSDAKKMEVCCAFAVTGNSRRVSEITKVPEGTIRMWKQTEWWQDIMSRIRQEHNEELDTKLTKLVDKAMDKINDRLENGDYVYNAKADKLIRKPVGARDLSTITATAIDKRQLLRGEPTSRVQRVSENEKLVRLAEEFKKFAQAKEVESVALNVEGDNYAFSDAEQEAEEGFQEEGQEVLDNELTINEEFSE
jgi:hypothetical protein